MPKQFCFFSNKKVGSQKIRSWMLANKNTYIDEFNNKNYHNLAEYACNHFNDFVEKEIPVIYFKLAVDVLDQE